MIASLYYPRVLIKGIHTTKIHKYIHLATPHCHIELVLTTKEEQEQ